MVQVYTTLARALCVCSDTGLLRVFILGFWCGVSSFGGCVGVDVGGAQPWGPPDTPPGEGGSSGVRIYLGKRDSRYSAACCEIDPREGFYH